MIERDFSLEKALSDESRRLSFRLKLAEDLGAAVLGIENPYESDESLIDFGLRLSVEQPDLAKQISQLYGRLVAVAGERSGAALLKD